MDLKIIQRYGDKAAKETIHQTYPSLTDAVVGVVKEANARPNKEQTARICECANHCYWSHLFSIPGEKTAGFKVADAEEVYRRLDGREPPSATSHKDSSKTASAHGGFQKTASPPTSATTSSFPPHPDYARPTFQPAPPIIKTASKPVSVMERYGVTNEAIQSQLLHDTTLFFDQAKDRMMKFAESHLFALHALRDEAAKLHYAGVPFRDMAACIKQASGAEEWKQKCIDQWLAPYMESLTHQKVASTYENTPRSRLPNPEAPFYRAFVLAKHAAEGYLAAAQDVEQTRPVLQALKQGLLSIHELQEQHRLQKEASWPNPNAGEGDPFWGAVKGGLSGVGQAGSALAGMAVHQGGDWASRLGGWIKKMSKDRPITMGGITAGSLLFGPDIIKHTLGLVKDKAQDVSHGLLGHTRETPDYGYNV